MGTRGAFGFIIDGQMKITLSKASSTPDDLGSDLLYWLHDADIEFARKQARDLKIVHANTFPTGKEIESLKHYANLSTGTGSLASWDVLLHDTFSDIQEILDAGYMIDSSEFPYRGGQCRWVYIIDLDKGIFEIYKAADGESHKNGRFANRGVPWMDKNANELYPVKLVTSYFFAFLPPDLEEAYTL
jgi:hypothetical protein